MEACISGHRGVQSQKNGHGVGNSDSSLHNRTNLLYQIEQWDQQVEMVGAAGIEPATLGLEIRCSIRLSYAPTVIQLPTIQWLELSLQTGQARSRFTRCHFQCHLPPPLRPQYRIASGPRLAQAEESGERTGPSSGSSCGGHTGSPVSASPIGEWNGCGSGQSVCDLGLGSCCRVKKPEEEKLLSAWSELYSSIADAAPHFSRER
jgi:hypothetical protein